MKQVVDTSATKAMMEQIDSIERKIKLMRNHISSATGTVDMQIFSSLWLTTEDCMSTLRDLSIKFL